VPAHDPGKAEDKCSWPENGAGAGDQDKYPAGFFYHDDSMIKVIFFPTALALSGLDHN